MTRIRRGYIWPLAVIAAVSAACTSSGGGPDPTPTTYEGVFVNVSTSMQVCVDEQQDCVEIGLPDADVTISAGDQMLWTGKTNDDGEVEEAYIVPDDEAAYDADYWTIAISSPPLLVDNVEHQIEPQRPDSKAGLKSVISSSITLTGWYKLTRG